MGKSLKVRLSRVIASFNSCRSKDPSSLPQDPNFFPHTNNKLISPDFQNPPKSSFKRHVSSESMIISVGCGTLKSSRSQEFKWEKEEKFHVVSSSFISEQEEINLALRPPPRFSNTVEKKKKKKKKMRIKKTKTKSRILQMSTSSADEYSGICSGTDDQTWYNNYNNVEEEETETLVSSSRSFDFSSDDDSSTDFNPQLETICETTTMRRRRYKSKRRLKHSRPSFSSSKGRRSSVSTSPDSELPARLSVFKKLIPCSVDGKVKESFAIVKKSQDPYEDFKRSMMEMILEKQMFEKNEIEQLLQCFLSLNGKHYHGVIVEAFSEIWETLFLGNDNDRGRRISSHSHPPTVCRTL
ncbi:hypothetical protein RND71_011823 [Anisodus tanguticus]|uniref:Transcription repressor n=1 Tax=Anisodus tanguticus TaxID=243964 RepID=A0AAE1SFP1_9SOLA|nr:hypothetical protein RND71_011823 [Anisodus tanguticus]